MRPAGCSNISHDNRFSRSHGLRGNAYNYNEVRNIHSHAEVWEREKLTDEDVFNLDDVLPKMLLKFGVQTY